MYVNIATPEEIEQVREECEDRDGHDTEAILNKYITPEEAIGMVVKHHPHGYVDPFCEITEIDVDEEEITLTHLFARDTTFTIPIGKAVDVPFPGDEFSVIFVEGLKDGEWERISNVSDFGEFRLHINKDVNVDEYDNTRQVEKTYTHGLPRLTEHKIRIDRQTGEPDITLDKDLIQNTEVLNKIRSSIEIPDDFDLRGHVVGKLYTDTHIVETNEGKERRHEIVWYNIDNSFRSGIYQTAVSTVGVPSV